MEEFVKKLKSDLRTPGVLSVCFTKTNGEVRNMRCTLQPDMVTINIDDFTRKSKNPKAKNADIVAVWDLDRNAWRSFRIDSIKSVFSMATGKTYMPDQF